jgi:hypothetical protein
MTDQTQPLDEVPKKLNLGNRTKNRHTGRPPGTRPRSIRDAEELLKQYGYDAPHVALLKLGNDDKIELPMGAQMLAWAAPYFGSKHAPTPTPRFVTEPLGLGELTDAASALRFTARIAELVQTGRLDVELARFFASLVTLFADLHEKVRLEVEVEKHRELALAAE